MGEIDACNPVEAERRTGRTNAKRNLHFADKKRTVSLNKENAPWLQTWKVSGEASWGSTAKANLPSIGHDES